MSVNIFSVTDWSLLDDTYYNIIPRDETRFWVLRLITDCTFCSLWRLAASRWKRKRTGNAYGKTDRQKKIHTHTHTYTEKKEKIIKEINKDRESFWSFHVRHNSRGHLSMWRNDYRYHTQKSDIGDLHLSYIHMIYIEYKSYIYIWDTISKVL